MSRSSSAVNCKRTIITQRSKTCSKFSDCKRTITPSRGCTSQGFLRGWCPIQGGLVSCLVFPRAKFLVVGEDALTSGCCWVSGWPIYITMRPLQVPFGYTFCTKKQFLWIAAIFPSSCFCLGNNYRNVEYFPFLLGLLKQLATIRFWHTLEKPQRARCKTSVRLIRWCPFHYLLRIG